MDLGLREKVVIITGSTGGIGKEIAFAFAEEGANVIVSGIENEAGAQTVAEITSLGGSAVYINANVCSKEETVALAEEAVKQFGRIDVLINNAGINIPPSEREPIHRFSDNYWDKILDVDLEGVYNCSKAVLQYMNKAKCGNIINISSIVGLVPLRNQCAFAVAKAAVNHLTKTMAIELAEDGINVNAILPGSINVPIMQEGGMYKDGRYESIMSHIPMKRPGSPRDIASAALFLASDKSEYITGNLLVVDGGWTCGFARDW